MRSLAFERVFVSIVYIVCACEGGCVCACVCHCMCVFYFSYGWVELPLINLMMIVQSYEPVNTSIGYLAVSASATVTMRYSLLCCLNRLTQLQSGSKENVPLDKVHVLNSQ